MKRDPELDKIRGLRVKECRKKRGLTQKQLADRIGCSKQTISNIETASKSRGLTLYYATKISHALDANADYLMAVTDSADGISSKFYAYTQKDCFVRLNIIYELLQSYHFVEKVTRYPIMDKNQIVYSWGMEITLKNGKVVRLAKADAISVFDALVDFMGFQLHKLL